MSDAGSLDVGQLSADGNWRWDGAAWQPAAAGNVLRPLPRWLKVQVRANATWVTLAGALFVGLVADQALRAGSFGLAASLTLATAALILLFAGRLLMLESRMLAAAS